MLPMVCPSSESNRTRALGEIFVGDTYEDEGISRIQKLTRRTRRSVRHCIQKFSGIVFKCSPTGAQVRIFELISHIFLTKLRISRELKRPEDWRKL